MYVCTYVRMYVCTYVRLYVCTSVRLYACTHVRMYVCTYVRMYVCTYVRIERRIVLDAYLVSFVGHALLHTHTQLLYPPLMLRLFWKSTQNPGKSIKHVLGTGLQY